MRYVKGINTLWSWLQQELDDKLNPRNLDGSLQVYVNKDLAS